MSFTKLKPSRIEVRATVKRADGTLEDLGCISLHDVKPWRLIWWKLKRKLRSIFNA